MIELPHKTTTPKGRLKDMNEICTLFRNPGFTAVATAVVTLLLTRLFDARAAKKKEQESFFYEIYRLRLKLYRKVLKQSSLFFDKASSFFAAGTIDCPKGLGFATGAFIELSDRSTLVASPAVSDTLKLISDFLRNEVIIGKMLTDKENVEPFISFMTEHLKLLRERIRAETCPALVDEYLFELTGRKSTHKASL